MGFESSLSQNTPQSSRPEKQPVPEFDVEEAGRLFSAVTSWESLENALKYLVYVPMSNGKKVSADEWIRTIDGVRNGKDIRFVTSMGGLRPTVDRLMKTIGGG